MIYNELHYLIVTYGAKLWTNGINVQDSRDDLNDPDPGGDRGKS